MVGGKEKNPSEARGTYLWMNLLQKPLVKETMEDDNWNGAWKMNSKAFTRNTDKYIIWCKER